MRCLFMLNTHRPTIIIIPPLLHIPNFVSLSTFSSLDFVKMELIMTAFVALLVYLFIAKIVSLMASDSRTEKSCTRVVEDVKFERSLKVEGTKRKKRVRFASDALVDDAVVCKVDKFQGQSSSVDNSEGSCDGVAVIVPEEKSEVSVESPALGCVVGSKIGGLLVEETCVDEVFGAGEGKVVGDEADCEETVKLGSDGDVVDDDQSEDVRVIEVGENQGSEVCRELLRIEKVGGEAAVKFDNQSEYIGVMEAKEDHHSEMEEIFDLEMVKRVDDQSEHLGVMEIGEDQGSGIPRELNGNENVDRETVVNFDDQSTEVRVLKLGLDQGIEFAKELNEGKNADGKIGNKLVSDVIVNELNEQVGLVSSQEDTGSEIETELESNENDGGQIGMTLTSDIILDDQSQHVKVMETGEIVEDQKCGIHSELNEREDSLIYDEDDDWEGIEKSELEKVFATAANYANDDQLLSLGSDAQMQLYGLHKVAMEGPCHEAQPMALKVSARAKWNAWQKLGNMSPDVAMEQYIDLLSDKFPGWSKQDNSTRAGEVDSTGAAMPGIPDPHTTTLVDTSQKEKKLELIFCSDGGVLAGRSNSVNEDEE